MRKWKETREKMGREYDAYTLKAVQEIELEMLECFLEICEKHDLTYFAFAGTGIGALRHGGFTVSYTHLISYRISQTRLHSGSLIFIQKKE